MVRVFIFRITFHNGYAASNVCVELKRNLMEPASPRDFMTLSSSLASLEPAGAEEEANKLLKENKLKENSSKNTESPQKWDVLVRKRN